ncbi:hypothetical protein CERSUDRAFT_110134 [Gelatoporia subvermispora B]|uniref:P-loop containing nucleoside triphosphate hydrolase protein n=1 Tax=Ceriporiopsis subvermispora (strain B) TaxID=914234 RepID=M2PXH8_CERS8|nr:hypothetical protein CERSUDRAFT_110134 [Gelatoporia subvermispora B]
MLRTQNAEVHAFPKQPEVWRNSLYIPAGAAALSAALLLLHIASHSELVKFLRSKLSASHTVSADDASSSETVVTSGDDERSCIRRHVDDLGGPTIFAFRLGRLLSVVALLALSTVTVISSGIRKAHSGASNQSVWFSVSLCGVYVLALLLSIATIAGGQRARTIACRHLATLLAITWGVYMYRDVWPLATYTLSPFDASEGWVLWVKVALLTVAGVVIPLTAPRQYTPLDPKDPQEPSPEQTASLISLMVYFWLDPLIWKAYKTPHLKLEELPPNADYDLIKSLIKKSYPRLDPFQVKTDRHMFWGLLRVFARECVILIVMIIIKVLMALASPIGIRQLLAYMETGGQGAVVYPWVWIAWLFFGPLIGSIAFQWYILYATRVSVRIQAIITSLVFDHALRIRVKADEDKSTGSVGPSASTTPDTASVVESTLDSASSEEETVRASSVGAESSGKKQKKDEKPDGAPEGEKSKNLVGRLNNLVTVDAEKITNANDFWVPFIMVPIQTSLSIWFLYDVLGWSSFVGLATMLALFPIPGYITSLSQKVQREKMKRTDARTQVVTETMNVIRMIKLFGWEPRTAEQIGEKRQDELSWQRKYEILNLSVNITNYVVPLVTMLTTFFTYTVIMEQELSASKIFSSMAVFDLLRESLAVTTGIIPLIIQAKVSLERVHDFLYQTELLDEFTAIKEGERFVPTAEVTPGVIGIRESAFTWANESDGTLTPGPPRRKFTLRVEEELVFERGHFNLIVGPTGSGKTSLLMALLGEMHYIPAGPSSYISLPREGGVAYAAQESWVQNETIRDNIIFGSPYDEERYNKVIEQCALQRDLTLFDAGDKTEVGEKGLTLSGGQKARVTLARAIYSSADVLLLDDVLAALDVHTAKWIVDKCFRGDLVRGRTVILVTHNVAIASPIADFVVSLGTDGRIASMGSLDLALAKNKKLSKELQEEKEEINKAEHEVDEVEPDVPARKDGKLIVEEEVEVGHVGWPAMKLYFKSLGGSHPVLFWTWCIGGIFSTNFIIAVQIWFLGYWAQQYEEHDPQDVHVAYYLNVYSVMLLVLTASFSSSWITWVIGGLRASRKIHQELIASVLGTTLRWLDRTPVSRIIARCTQDVDIIDSKVQNFMFWIIDQTLDMSIRFFAVIVFSPIFSIPGVIIAGIGGACGQVYMKAQLCVKREMSNAKAPVLGHFGAAIGGLTSIRAYGAQEVFKRESMKRIDRFTRAAVPFYNLNRWICIRLDALGGLFASSLAVYLIYFTNIRASNIGFSLNMAVGFAQMILWWIRIMNELELSGTSLERVLQYINIEHESKSTPDGVPPAYWPASGGLRVEKLSARYSPDGPRVLHEVSFEVKSGERVGIVGRTGSGKSSLTLSLLCCIITEGKVYYDGLDTSSINLDSLRSHITIIPQVPELLAGTLRQNLDPFDQHDDAVLNDALRAAGLFSLQGQDDEGRITLDSEIASGGSNLSVGQRQILALARAIVRQSKLLILDEGIFEFCLMSFTVPWLTFLVQLLPRSVTIQLPVLEIALPDQISPDYATDAIIQRSLRTELGKDVTLLTIAHRLQTIMDADKIMVLDAGRIVEFDTPSALLENPEGILRALVEESGDKEALLNMARGASAS